MTSPSDPDLKDLAAQQRTVQQIERLLWILLPILALVLAFVIANWNIASTIGTFIMLATAFVLVGIYRKSVVAVIIGSMVYCFIDNYFSYGHQLNLMGLKRQMVVSIIFILSIGLFRPWIERQR